MLQVGTIRNDFSHTSAKYPQPILSDQDMNVYFNLMKELLSELKMSDILIEKIEQVIMMFSMTV